MKNTMRPLVLVFGALLAVVALPAGPARAQEIKTLAEVGPRVRRILGDEAADLLVRAQRAEVFELEDPYAQRARPASKPGSLLIADRVVCQNCAEIISRCVPRVEVEYAAEAFAPFNAAVRVGRTRQALDQLVSDAVGRNNSVWGYTGGPEVAR
jgi:hypothetical protein